MAGAEPEAEGGDRQGDHDGHENGRDAVGEPLHGRLAGLGVGDELGDLSELGGRADARHPDDETAAGVDRRARDVVTGPDLDGHGFAREQ